MFSYKVCAFANGRSGDISLCRSRFNLMVRNLVRVPIRHCWEKRSTRLPFHFQVARQDRPLDSLRVELGSVPVNSGMITYAWSSTVCGYALIILVSSLPIGRTHP